MNELMLFQKEEFGQVRVVERNGEPWFVAKDVAVAFNRVLCEQHIQYKQNGTYVLYAEYAELGYVHIKQEVLENDKVVYHRRWTQLGREWLIGRFGIKAA